ncbi:MAG TPA: bifunctional diguanylate cyclase/phosphodiesterase [Mycobacteriales bacterium]|nr:bifunctional diguanylate cyclase/phosphodiesterase [Mycobacteriales bacterium]
MSVIGLPVTAIAIIRVPWSHLGSPLPTILIASAFLVIGELRPIPVSRGADAGDELSISSTIAVALLFLTAPGVACAAQAFALAVDETRSRRQWSRLAFNISQYTLALIATREVFSAVAGESVLGRPASFTPHDLPAAFLSALAFFVINNGLTGVAVAIATRMPIRRLVQADLRSHMPTDGVLLALAPLVTESLAWSIIALPLLMLPLIAVHRSARLASQREHEALHDALTGLPNRSSLLMRLRQACEDLETVPVAVMMLDLDHFKEVNDTLGHYVGDRLLIEVASRLRGALRQGDFIARLGGDEFAILAYHTDSESDALDVAARVRAAFETTFPLSGADLAAQCSLGVAMAPRDGSDEDLLLKRADVALYDAKTARGSVMIYDGSRDDHSVERLALVADLRRGIESGDVFPLYQPQCDASTGDVIGVEALARWRHPQAGILAPSEFLDVAEGAGMLDALTDSLLGQCLEHLASWHRSGQMIRLSLNVSPRTMRDVRFVDRVRTALEVAGIEPRWLTLEVTEHVMVGDAARSIRELERLRRLGCRIAIDDFGTGYSSIAYLKRLPVDELKIDRSFVSELGENPKDEIIVRAIVDLGHRFGLEVTAEGVETEPAWALLAAIGCDAIQGYRLARPLTAEALNAWLNTRESIPTISARPLLKVL